jgi:hypothetical protein
MALPRWWHRAKEISYERFGFRRPRDFKADGLIAGLDNDFEREKRTALALQIDKLNQSAKHFRCVFKSIRIAHRQRRYLTSSAAKSVQNRAAPLAHFSVGEGAGYRRFHPHSLAGLSLVEQLQTFGYFPHDRLRVIKERL